MKMSGTRLLDAPREEVWRKLNDPGVLERCIPGCERLEKVSDTELTAVVAVKLGPLKARFDGEVELQNISPPNSYRISGSGKGGAAGSASGGADVRLATVNGGTELTYDVDASVRGKIAQLGARLIDATAASLAKQFFDNFSKEVSSPAPAAVEGDAAPAPKPAVGPASSDKPVSGAQQWIWWILALAVLAALGLWTQFD